MILRHATVIVVKQFQWTSYLNDLLAKSSADNRRASHGIPDSNTISTLVNAKQSTIGHIQSVLPRPGMKSFPDFVAQYR